MATVNELKATARPRAGKGAARAVRREGRVPGVIYGDGQPPLTISLDYDELKHRIFAGRFLTSICNVEVDGQKHRTIPRDFQLDPVRDLPIHVDFMRLGEGATIRVRIPVHVKNADQSPGVKRGGAVNIVTHHVEVVCLADAIPEGGELLRQVIAAQESPAELVDGVASALIVDPALRQRLLETRDVGQRLERVAAEVVAMTARIAAPSATN